MEISKSDLLKAYNEADDNGKKLLENLFDSHKDVFKPLDICDRIKTFEDAFKIINPTDPEVLDLLAYKGTNKYVLGAVALVKLEIICEALNEGWKPDWTDSNEYKYYVWSRFGSLGWSADVFGCNAASSSVGSRLVVRSEKLAVYLGRQFQPLYNDLYTK